MVKLLDRVKMTVTGTPGTGNITLNAAEAGFQTFAQAGAVDTDVVRYAVTDGTNFEIGTAVLSSSATVMARTVQQSSNSNNALNLTSNAVVFATLSAADLTGNPAPRWTTTPVAAINLEKDNSTAVTLSGVAIDEGGYPIQYSWDAYSGSTLYSPSNLPPQLASAPVISSSGVASLVGSSTESNAGNFNFRLRASDGVNTITSTTDVALDFFYTNNLVGWYDAAESTSYSGSGSTFNDKRGSGYGPALTLHTTNTNNTTYNASGTGSKPSFNASGAFSFSTTHNFGTGQSVVLIMSRVVDGTLALNGDPQSGGTLGMLINNTSSNANSFGSASWQLASSSSEIFVDKTSLGTGSTPTRAQVYAGLTGSGITSATAAQMHSLVQTDLNLSGGFAVGNANGSPEVEIRAILIYNEILSSANVTIIHNKFKEGYPSSAHMPA